MKSVVVLAVICWLALSGASLASPVPEISSNGASKTSNSLESSGRQAVAPVAPAAPAASDDDDDDDDDEDDLDVDLDISDDDDDDEDDDEDGGGTGGSDDDDDDDDEDDYLERFIDDILGGDEDDDDDDETASVVEPVQPAAPVPASAPVQAVQPIVQAAPSIPAAVQADLNALSAEAAAEEAANIAETSASEAESASYEDEEVGETVPEGQAATNLESGLIGGNIEGVESQGNPVVNAHQVAPVIIQQPTGTTPDEDDDDDDDEDDEDDDVDLEIPEIDEDDDDDDDEDEDDDDDDDDDDTDARQARAMETNTNNHVPAIYVAKYNRFVDNILGRINKILRTNYDPVTVKLTNPSPSTKSKTKSTKKKTKKNGGKKNGSKKSASGSSTNDQSVDKVQQINDLATSPATKSQEIGQKNFKDVTTTPIPDNISNAIPEAVATTPRAMEIITLQEPENRASATTPNKKQKTKRTKTKNKTKNKAPSSGSTPNKNKPKVKKQSKPKARATLYGLSSLKRSGDVSVNMMRDHTTIRTKFRLGPLMLKVEKEFGRAAKKELRSAIATTAEMSGKLSLRVMHGGAATLHSIRVLQPKQVRVESADDHDRTREFVWRRSSHIAHLVSQKLSSATRSMLRPPPIPATSA